MTITQQQIAEEANVSRSTVSAVMSESQRGRISLEVQQRVMTAAGKLGYRPNRYAQVMRSGKSGYIGIVNFGAFRHLPQRKVQAATEAIRDHGYEWVVQEAIWYQSEEKSANQLVVQGMIDARVEGVLLVYPDGHFTQFHLQQLLDAGIPVVAIVGEHLTGIPKYLSDRRWGYAMLTKHLIALGYRRLALLKVDCFNDSEEGLEQALETFPELRSQVQIHCPSLDNQSLPDYSSEAAPFLPGQCGMETLLASEQRPDAVICANDYWAMGALTACFKAGLRVPQDIALTGFDNDPTGQFGAVPITTIDHPVRAISQQAVEHLVQLIQNKAPLMNDAVLIRGQLS